MKFIVKALIGIGHLSGFLFLYISPIFGSSNRTFMADMAPLSSNSKSSITPLAPFTNPSS